ncbi:RNA-dependent RNA polymerase [Melia azedarach]|uniref:RNA-dependent RNA polymerase n=1 Tax=Melia azedarach TaxID=155640 RepID=A0ACC1XB54_MELAZ|nr:RNA-dependent RNA polymerase [Melia azedarach]
MCDSTQQVPLPHSVEQLILKICADQDQPPPDAGARRGLASLGEEGALEVLRTIAGQKIKYTFSGFVMHLIKIRSNSNGSPLKRLCLSPSQQNRSPVAPVRLMNSSQDDGTSHSPIPEQPRGFPLSSSLQTVSDRASIPQYVALGELEFRKAFLILSYIGEKNLEEVITADEIRGLKDLQMVGFELEVWKALGRKYIKQEDRRMSFDWDSGKTHFYHCHVSLHGSCTFKGPYLNQTRSHLQKELGDDNVLMVKFAEEVAGWRSSTINFNDYAKYKKIAKEGILVGLRRYRFFVFKDGGKEEKKKDPSTSPVKCYFVRMESDASIDKGKHYVLSGKTVHEARAMFMHAHTVSSVANYMSRLSLILSKTMKLEVDLSTVHIERIEDIPCRDEDGNIVYKDGKMQIHTDGTGFISEDLALRCPTHVNKGKSPSDDNIERSIDRKELEAKFSDVARPESRGGEPPLLMQVRLFYKGLAVKGTLLVNKKLHPRTIQIRPSMIKVETDPDQSYGQTFNSLEVVKTSNQPRKTYLSKNLIALLSYGGVPEIFFVNILRSALEDANSVFSNKRNALKVSLNHGEMDDFIATTMILSGISLDEPYLQYRLSILMKKEKKGLQSGKLPLTESYYLMGTVDPTGILKSNEVSIMLNDGQVSWEKVLVYRNPGLHFGDIHVLKAVYVEELQELVGTAKYAIFFPCKGPRSLADEIAGGDFDGDMYFVSRNPELLKHFRESERWVPTSSINILPNKRPSDFSPEELEHELFNLFLTTRFRPSYAMGVAADSWQAIMDRYLTLGDESADEKAVMKENMLRLINLYYDALDAPKKTGQRIEIPEELKVERFPSYMGRDEAVSFESKSVLGTIYSIVRSYEAVDLSVKEVWKLPCFDDVLPEADMTKWKGYYDQYRQEMRAALQNGGEDKDEAAKEIIKKYKQILYGGEEFEQRTRRVEEIYNEALAIYHITYDHARSQGAVSYCNFAWKAAGSALCKLHVLKQSERTMVCSASVLKEICG